MYLHEPRVAGKKNFFLVASFNCIVFSEDLFLNYKPLSVLRQIINHSIHDFFFRNCPMAEISNAERIF